MIEKGAGGAETPAVGVHPGRSVRLCSRSASAQGDGRDVVVAHHSSRLKDSLHVTPGASGLHRGLCRVCRGVSEDGRRQGTLTVMPRPLRRLCAMFAVAALGLAVVSPLGASAHCRGGETGGHYPDGHHHDPSAPESKVPPGPDDADCPHCPPTQCSAQTVCLSFLLHALPQALAAPGLPPHSAAPQGPVTPHPARSSKPPTHPPSLAAAIH